MTFSYDNHVADTLSQVRFLLGDTDSTNVQLQDEEISYLLSDAVDPLEAAIGGADSIAARYANQVDYSEGDIRESLMQRQLSWERVADRLRRKISRRGLSPWLGGLRQSDKDSTRQDTSLVPHVFQSDMETEPGTEQQQPQYPVVSPFPY